MYYSLLFKCLIGVFNYNIFMESNLKQPRLFRVYLESFEPFGLLIVWINMASDKEKVPKGKMYRGTTCCKRQC